MTAFLFVCIFPILPVLYFMLRSEAKPRKNIVLGVTLPFAAQMHPDVLIITESYKKQLGLLALILAVLSAVCFFVRHMSIALTILLCWTMLCIVLLHVPYIHYHRKLKALKLEQGWFNEAASETLVDLTAISTLPHKNKAWWFAPAFLLSVVPVYFSLRQAVSAASGEWPMTWIYATFALLVLFFYFFYLIINRQRAEVVNEDTAMTMALTCIRRRQWANCWLSLSYLTAVYSVCIWLFTNNFFFLLSTCIYTILMIIIVLYAEFKTRNAQYKLTFGKSTAIYTDEDAHWLLGMFYYNPADSHFMINNRVGIGTTVNMAKRGAQVLMAISALCILLLPLSGVWLICEEFTPMQLSVSDTAVIANHLARTYTVDRADIQSVSLLEELPNGKRVAGTGMDTLLKGKFNFEGIGACNICLNPQVPPFIRINTPEGVYIFGAPDSAQTRAYYQMLAQE